MHFKVVIPARYGSTRLAGKPLLDIAGKPMVQHVYERGLASGAEHVVVATDDTRIADVVTGFGGEVCMTSDQHRSGTERLSEVIDKLAIAEDEIIVNLQGDEPMMPAAVIRQVAADLAQHTVAGMSTVCEPITDVARLFDPNVVKVVRDQQGFALYFSRATIPWNRDEFARSTQQMPANSEFFRHIGLYAYRAGFIKRYLQWPACPLEQIESLEQLRVLWHGEKIFVSEAMEATGAGVDTAEDLARVRASFGA